MTLIAPPPKRTYTLTSMSPANWIVLRDWIEHPDSLGEDRARRLACSISNRANHEKALAAMGYLVDVKMQARTRGRYRLAEGAALPPCPCCRQGGAA